jgi:hypothetical protein
MSGERRTRTVGILCVLTVAVAGGVVAGPAAYAIWTKQLTATGSVTAGTVATSATVAGRASSITNDAYQTTFLVQVTNDQPVSSTYAGTSDVTVTTDPASGTGLGSLVSVAIWPVAAAEDCTAASEPASGYRSAEWSAGLTSAPVAVLPNASASFCVRGYPTGSTPSPSAPAAAQNRVIVAAALGSASGTQIFSPSYTATLSRGNFTAQAASRGATAIATSLIYTYSPVDDGVWSLARPLVPADTCWNIEAGGTTSQAGLDLIAYSATTCVTSSTVGPNERFVMIPVPGTSSFQIRADSTVATWGFLEADAAGTLVEAQSGNVDELRQIWIGQATNSGRQFVNAATGLCLQAPATAGSTFSTAPCTTDGRFRSSWFPATVE